LVLRDPLSSFHPLVREWFTSQFAAPTGAQAEGWPAIAQGRHTLIAAPTGSGKTLAAFLTCLDGLVRQGLEGEIPDKTQVVYVSPLKALSNDIHRNLMSPLRDLQDLAEARGTPLPDIRVAVRTGDTPQSERQRMAKKPPHVLVTTPESFFILLTSESGRRGLKSVSTLIVDELHAVADDKRGSHLSISMERLVDLSDEPITRIGLSATQNPIEEIGKFLVGTENIDTNGAPDCSIVDTGHAREIDLGIEMPKEYELGPIASHDLWDRTLDRIVELTNGHRTTLLFVNTRRLVERLAHQLSGKIGEEQIVAHHGSMSHERRHEAERKLKDGEVKLCVATASLELGIDIGAIDLVCQIGSPRSVSVLLQRTGRSGHHVGGTPKGRLFPLTRDELIESMALVRALRHGVLDALTIPDWPLDVLAQQIVAECASKDCGEDELFDLVRRAYPYRNLPRERYAETVKMLADGPAPREGRRRAYLHRDVVNGRLKARRGARIAALTNAGAIPDNASYDVIAEPENTFVGQIEEDFAVESMRGQVFLLGNNAWKIRRVMQGKVLVEDAHGQAPTIPFWFGEAPGRTTELSDEVSDLREGIYERLESGGAAAWLIEEGFGRDAAEQAVAYIEEGIRILGTVPTKKRIVAERFFDESGGMQLVVHSPYGSRINKAWGFALRKEICRTFDFELQAAATEDGINLSLGPSLSFPLEDVFKYVPLPKVEKILTQAVLQVPLFPIRWRWDASRALAILRFSNGKKTPPALLRMRSDDLLAAVFPEQVMCQDNAMPGDVEVPDHPLVFETMRDALHEAMDMNGFKRVLEDISDGQVEILARDTTQPSVFSHQILNAMPYAFLDEDNEIGERRSRAVALRRALPEDQRDLASLDMAAIRDAARDAWPLIRDADELHDALLTLGIMPLEDAHRDPEKRDQLRDWFDRFLNTGRASVATYGEGAKAWVATESVPLVLAAFPDASFEPGTVTLWQSEEEPPTQDDAERILVRSRTECIGPFTVSEIADSLGMRRGAVEIALAHLEGTGNILRGRFTPGREDEEFCDRRILARIHRETIGRLRREIEPVPPATFMRFLIAWQRAAPPWKVRDEGGLLDVIEQMQGFEAATGAWESEILPSRVMDYLPGMLDELCISGDVAWGRFSRRPIDEDMPVTKGTLTRTGRISLALRESVPWLLSESQTGENGLLGAQGEVLTYLAESGASFMQDIVISTGRLPSDVEDALWRLAAAGLVTSDGFTAVRGMINGTAKKQPRRAPTYGRGLRRRVPSSRWSLLRGGIVTEDVVEARAWQLLRRYGVVFPELLVRESNAPRWRDLLRVYRRAEARGEIRGGRFVANFVGEQYAIPEAVERLRNIRRTDKDDRLVVLSACDPLNLAGITSPGSRVPALLDNKVVYRNGVPVASVEGGSVQWRDELDDVSRERLISSLSPPRDATLGTRRVTA
jgi:ATP-dependent Lhr-like helicase